MKYENVDEKDWAIIDMLKANSRMSNSEIARKINVSEGTVRKRIERLVADGVIRKFTVILKSEGIEGLVLMRTEVIRVDCKSLEELNRLVDDIRGIDGVKSTDTLVRLH